MSLPILALGVALGDVDHGVTEEGGENMGPRIRQYLKNCDPPINVAAPWCAAAVQYWADVAADAWEIPNPLSEVRLEAYVRSYHQWARDTGRLLDPAQARAGDLILYDFRRKGWDHIGIVLKPLRGGMVSVIEGNTSPGVGASAIERERDGDGVYTKVRTIARQPTAIVRWA